MGVRDVSGKATLAVLTVNHRFGFPDLRRLRGGSRSPSSRTREFG